MPIKIQKTKYNLSLIDNLRVKAIKIRLLMTRIMRGKRFVGINGFIIFSVLSIIWLLFSILQMILEPCIDNEQIGLIESIWQVRREYISTVIVVIAIDVCNKVFDNRKKLKKQHLLYYDLITTADTIFEPFVGEMIVHYMPFYNEKMYLETYEYITEKDKGKTAVALDKFEKPINELMQSLISLGMEIKNGNLIVRNEELLLCQIEEAMSELIAFGDRISEGNEQPTVVFEQLTSELFSIIDSIRFIWRLDISERERIIKILFKNNKEAIEQDFYKRMFVYSVQDIERIVL